MLFFKAAREAFGAAFLDNARRVRQSGAARHSAAARPQHG